MGYKNLLVGLLCLVSPGQCWKNFTGSSIGVLDGVPTGLTASSFTRFSNHSSTQPLTRSSTGYSSIHFSAPSTQLRPQATTHLPTHINFQDRNLNTIEQIYNITIYPNNQGFITNGPSAVPTGLFNENATGRITPIGNFTGFEDSVEYFFGLTPPPQAPVWDTWTSAKIVSYTSGCPEVASSVVYGTTTGVNPDVPETYGKYISTIKQVRYISNILTIILHADKSHAQIAFWRFDEQGAVLYYDAWFPTLSDYVNLLYGTSPNPQYDAGVIESICSQAQMLCVGGNAQYTSQDECISTLSAKPFGDWDEAWGDNIVCRILHILLAKLRPSVRSFHSLFAVGNVH